MDPVPAARVARLATVGEDRRPHLVPICFAVEGDTLYTSVDEKPKRTRRLRRLRDLAANPQVTVLVDHYDDDWSHLWWAQLRGRARVLESGPEFARALHLLADKYAQYRARPPAGPVIAVDVEERVEWAASSAG